MRRFNLFLAVLAVAILVIPGAALAANVGGEVFGAYNTYGMNDVNDAITASNQALGTNFDELNGGITGGLAVRVWPTGNWMFSAAWEPIFLETEDTASSTKLNADAHSYQATAAYFFPSVMPAKYGIGGGVGMYNLAGKVSAPGNPDVDMTGNGFGFHVMGLSEWTVSPGFAITAGAGWRWAQIDIDDTVPTQQADYTGFMGRVGLAFYLPSP